MVTHRVDRKVKWVTHSAIRRVRRAIHKDLERKATRIAEHVKCRKYLASTAVKAH